MFAAPLTRVPAVLAVERATVRYGIDNSGGPAMETLRPRGQFELAMPFREHPEHYAGLSTNGQRVHRYSI